MFHAIDMKTTGHGHDSVDEHNSQQYTMSDIVEIVLVRGLAVMGGLSTMAQHSIPVFHIQ